MNSLKGYLSRSTAPVRRSSYSALTLLTALFALSAMSSLPAKAGNDNGKIKRAAKTTQARSCCAGAKSAGKAELVAQGKAEENKSAPARKDVLEPSQFFGLASFGYASAKACPEVMEKLFCYCGCDLTDKHVSLLDCFTSPHGVDCHICQEEAILANKLHKDGVSTLEIQKTIDEKYAHEYPFQDDTPSYKQYKSSRLYIKDAGGSPVKFGSQVAGPDAPDDKPATTNPKLKPGKEAGKCCAGADHEHGSKDKAKKEKSRN